MVVALGSVNAVRLRRGSWLKITGQAASLGYAVPSAVLAIGVIVVFVAFDKFLMGLFPAMTRLALSMSSLMLVFAFAARFLTIGRQSVEAGFAKIGRVHGEASRRLGRGPAATLLLVELPLIRPAVATGASLVFVDVAKELPLSLILRPFNTETLGTWAYHFAKNQVLPETAAPSLIIIAAGAAFILLAGLWDRSVRDCTSR